MAYISSNLVNSELNIIITLIYLSYVQLYPLKIKERASKLVFSARNRQKSCLEKKLEIFYFSNEL